jgi:hypothetical protein
VVELANLKELSDNSMSCEAHYSKSISAERIIKENNIQLYIMLDEILQRNTELVIISIPSQVSKFNDIDFSLDIVAVYKSEIALYQNYKRTSVIDRLE